MGGVMSESDAHGAQASPALFVGAAHRPSEAATTLESTMFAGARKGEVSAVVSLMPPRALLPRGARTVDPEGMRLATGGLVPLPVATNAKTEKDDVCNGRSEIDLQNQVLAGLDSGEESEIES